ncbi:dienelactone hydrolase family protein [Sphingomonas sp. 1P06PA]|uniref:carboxylesterase family protein n=1 Tax=Sphingomonas sp. 1P06PA TaxID=554121 RepID=UPI0039A73131
MSILLMALLLVGAAPPPEGSQAPQPAAGKGGYRYQLFVPRGYAAARSQRWPLIIFLHGSGERGEDIDKVRVHGPPKIVADHPGFPFLLVSPLLAADADWDVAKLDALLAAVRRRWRVDADRIYLTGLSRGGHATWRWAASAPDLFAAIAPVSGRGDPAQACALRDLPVWAFHGDADDVVPPVGSFAMVEAIRACGGKPRLTIYPATGHDGWTPTYDDPALYRWLLEQRRVRR